MNDVRCYPILLFFGKNIPEEICNRTYYGPAYLDLSIGTVPCELSTTACRPTVLATSWRLRRRSSFPSGISDLNVVDYKVWIVMQEYVYSLLHSDAQRCGSEPAPDCCMARPVCRSMSSTRRRRSTTACGVEGRAPV